MTKLKTISLIMTILVNQAIYADDKEPLNPSDASTDDLLKLSFEDLMQVKMIPQRLQKWWKM